MGGGEEEALNTKRRESCYQIVQELFYRSKNWKVKGTFKHRLEICLVD